MRGASSCWVIPTFDQRSPSVRIVDSVQAVMWPRIDGKICTESLSHCLAQMRVESPLCVCHVRRVTGSYALSVTVRRIQPRYRTCIDCWSVDVFVIGVRRARNMAPSEQHLTVVSQTIETKSPRFVQWSIKVPRDRSVVSVFHKSCRTIDGVHIEA